MESGVFDHRGLLSSAKSISEIDQRNRNRSAKSINDDDDAHNDDDDDERFPAGRPVGRLAGRPAMSEIEDVIYSNDPLRCPINMGASKNIDVKKITSRKILTSICFGKF